MGLEANSDSTLAAKWNLVEKLVINETKKMEKQNMVRKTVEKGEGMNVKRDQMVADRGRVLMRGEEKKEDEE